MLKKYVVLPVGLMTIFCTFAEAAEGVRSFNYTYQMAKRFDPFVPFFTKSELSPPDSPIDPPQNRGGLSLEPGQLQLVAVIFAQGEQKALVEDVAGKGYFLYEGLPVGRYGTVRKIENGQVIIEETYHTSSGRIVAKKTVMRLKKEGE